MPVTLTNITNDTFKATMSSTGVPPSPPPSEAAPLQSFNDHLWYHPFYKRLLGPLPSNIDTLGVTLKEAISNDSLTLATDGSYSPSHGRGSHSWVFTSKGNTIWWGQGPTDGHPSLLSPYRAELRGILAGLHVVQCICAYYDLSTGKVQLVSDCLKAIKTLQRYYQDITKYYQEESDLVVEAMSVLSNIPIRMTLSWIESHYKGTERTAAHDLNDEAHLLAKKLLILQ
jgi:hypothetical protein